MNLADKPLLNTQEVMFVLGLSEGFIRQWASPQAELDYKAGVSAIPGMPVVRPGEKWMLFPRELLWQWLLKYFGSGCEERKNPKSEPSAVRQANPSQPLSQTRNPKG